MQKLGCVPMPLEKSATESYEFLSKLEEVIESRKQADPEKSYTSQLLQGPKGRLFQKVGEEAVEYIIEAMQDNREKATSEGADLLFHFLVSLHGLGLTLGDIVEELRKRHK